MLHEKEATMKCKATIYLVVKKASSSSLLRRSSRHLLTKWEQNHKITSNITPYVCY